MSGHTRHLPGANLCSLSLTACLVTQSSIVLSESKFPCVLYTNVFNLDHLHSHSSSCWPCSLAVALHAHSHGLAAHQRIRTFNREIFECTHLKFMVSGWSILVEVHLGELVRAWEASPTDSTRKVAHEYDIHQRWHSTHARSIDTELTSRSHADC